MNMISTPYISQIPLQELSSIEKLSSAQIGEVIVQLTQVTGTPQVRNIADISVTMRYVSHLAITSKKMYQLINESDATHLFLNSLAVRYQNSPENFAVWFNTIGARKWLWKLIEDRQDSKTFQAIQDIYTIVLKALNDKQDADLDKPNLDNCFPDFCYDHYITKQGFFLATNSCSYAIHSPFGLIRIGQIDKVNSRVSILKQLIEKLNAVFDSIEFGFGYKNCFEVIPSDDSYAWKEIDSDQISSKRGTNQIIISHASSYSTRYKIQQLGENSLPDAQYYEAEHYPDTTVLRAIWKMLETDQQGQDPVQKVVTERPVYLKNLEAKSLPFQQLGEVPTWAVNWIQKAEELPITKDEDGYLSQTLTLDKVDEAEVLCSLHCAAQVVTKSPITYHFHTTKKWKELTLLYQHEVKHQNKSYLDSLKNAYRDVLKALSFDETNWTQVKLKDYPTILFKASEEDSILFMKNKLCSFHEANLLKIVRHLLHISFFVDCSYEWEGVKLDSEALLPYLWIKKDKLDDAKKYLSFA